MSAQAAKGRKDLGLPAIGPVLSTSILIFFEITGIKADLRASVEWLLRSMRTGLIRRLSRQTASSQ